MFLNHVRHNKCSSIIPARRRIDRFGNGREGTLGSEFRIHRPLDLGSEGSYLSTSPNCTLPDLWVIDTVCSWPVIGFGCVAIDLVLPQAYMLSSIS
jgi:hypothetical protein